MDNPDVPTIEFHYDKFFTLTEREEWKREWFVEELSQNEFDILNIMLKSIDKSINDVSIIAIMTMKRNSFVSLLIRFKDESMDEVFEIRRINNTKFRIMYDGLNERKLVGFIVCHCSLYPPILFLDHRLKYNQCTLSSLLANNWGC